MKNQITYTKDANGKRIPTEYRKQQMREYQRAHYAEIIKYQSEYKSKKSKSDPLYRLERNLRASIRHAFRHNGWKSGSKLHALIGMEFEEYKSYIESQWTTGMNWFNYGQKSDQWVIEHQTPISSGKTEEEVRNLFHWSNTKPMWQLDNVRKGNKQKGLE